jgi:hypothetical protein
MHVKNGIDTSAPLYAQSMERYSRKQFSSSNSSHQVAQQLQLSHRIRARHCEHADFLTILKFSSLLIELYFCPDGFENDFFLRIPNSRGGAFMCYDVFALRWKPTLEHSINWKRNIIIILIIFLLHVWEACMLKWGGLGEAEEIWCTALKNYEMWKIMLKSLHRLHVCTKNTNLIVFCIFYH